MKHCIALISLLTITTITNADQLEISLSDKSIDGAYETYYSNNFSTQISLMHTDMDNVENVDASFDYSKAAPPLFLSNIEDNTQTNMAGFGMFANGKQGNIKTHLGGKVFYIDSEHGNDLFGIALGGALDAYIRPNFFISGQILYAPDIITSGDFDNYFELSTRANFQIIQNASIYIGYKDMEADFDKHGSSSSANREFFKGAFVGFRFNL